MIDDESRSNPADGKQGNAPTRNDAADAAPGDRRREPVFTDFDEEDFEESERDTDYASAYEEDEDDEEYLASSEEEDTEVDPADWQVLGGSPEVDPRSNDASRNPWAEKEPASTDDDDSDIDTAGFTAMSGAALFERDEEDLADDELEDDWEDQEDYTEEAEAFETDQPESAHSWPLGLVVVGVVALVLLAAGGYGVIQQRSVAEAEIRQLQAALATAGNPAELAANRDALREMEQRYDETRTAMDALTLENRRLTDMVAGLEQQLGAQQAPAKKAPAPPPVTAPSAAKVAPKPAAAAATAPTGDWFVNFSSYSQRSAAESWARKLKPSTGRAVVAASSKDGQTFYRVRIVGLADRAQAEKVSAQLQSAHNMPPLWVGKE